MTIEKIEELVNAIGLKAKSSANSLAYSDPEKKRRALLNAALSVLDNKTIILEANKEDIERSINKDLSEAMLDRLKLNEDRVNGISNGLVEIANLTDPVGKILDEWIQPTGLNIKRVQTPLGVIGVIYESRPNVTADAGGLCFKAGNSVILRGGSESQNSSIAIHKCLIDGLLSEGFSPDIIQLVPTQSRAAVSVMLKMAEHIDVIVPRGGKSLVQVVQEQAKVPVFAHLEGIVNIYIDIDADFEKTLNVVLNSKTRRTGICGAAECILIHKDVIDTIAGPVIKKLLNAGVKVNVDRHLQSIKGTALANESHWGKEYLDMEISARVVENIDDAIEYIRKYGSNHTDCIMTENDKTAKIFMNKVDSAILMHNVSTQFADGGEFGMGAEIGIATGKMHARGPVGVDQLTSFKYIVSGDGCLRS
tara:strand:- start:482 stop:1744 length:1263 start_codon:yes stop_codon:yes gene_type:complete